MSLKVRRVITGHDRNGKAIVSIDEVATHLYEGRPGAVVCNVWTTDESPANNSRDEDAGKRDGRFTMLPNGTVFRIIEFKPGVTPRMHRTDSIDYLVVMSGEIDMELDDGVEVRIRQGDVMVQRGTIHNWINRGSASCVVAVVLVHAHPVEAGGKVLNAIG